MAVLWQFQTYDETEDTDENETKSKGRKKKSKDKAAASETKKEEEKLDPNIELNDKLDPSPINSIETDSIILLNDKSALKRLKRKKKLSRDEKTTLQDKEEQKLKGAKKKESASKTSELETNEEEETVVKQPKPSTLALLKELYLWRQIAIFFRKVTHFRAMFVIGHTCTCILTCTVNLYLLPNSLVEH